MRFAVLLPFLAALLPAQSVGVGSVDGTVVNRVTGVGISGVSVILYTREAIRYQAITDDSGRFRTTGMVAGSYEVRFEKDDQFVLFRAAPAKPYMITTEQPSLKMTLEVTQLVSVRGRVVDIDGKPAANVDVKLGYFPAKTDERGEFTIERVEPGSYPLLASPAARSTGATNPPSDGHDRTEPIPTYYPSVSDLSAAQTIAVRGDADLSGYEIRLQTGTVSKLGGVIFDQLGNPAPRAKVKLLPIFQHEAEVTGTSSSGSGLDSFTVTGAGPRPGPESANTVSGYDGMFEFPSVRPGDFAIVASSSAGIDSVDFIRSIRSGSVAVTVGRSDIDRLEIRLAAPFPLSFTADWGDAPPQLAFLGLRPADGQDGLGGGFVRTYLDSKLSTVEVTPGRYYVMPPSGPGYYPVSVQLGGTEVLGQATTIVSGSPALKVSYKAARGTVRGTVEKGAGASVVLLPQQIQSVAFGRVAHCRPDGTFEMTGVAPGDYYAVAIERMDTPSALMGPAFLPKIASSGVKLRVDQSAGSPLDLKPIRWPE